jgi:hypothetical protein
MVADDLRKFGGGATFLDHAQHIEPGDPLSC